MTASGAVSAPLTDMHQGVARQDGAIVKIHRRGHRHHYQLSHGPRRVVDAPVTRVESGRQVLTEAPFTRVHAGRRGRYLRFPFVSLWFPR